MEKDGTRVAGNLKVFDRLDSLSGRDFYLLVSGVLFLALVLRIAALLYLKKSVYFDFLLWDERLYHTWASKISDGAYKSLSVYEFAPLPAYVMALVYKIFSPDILYIRILNIILGVLTCSLIYLIGKEVGSRITGFFACLVASLYKPFIFYSIVPLKTSLCLVLFASSVYLLVAILDKHSTIKVLVLGIVIGLTLNVRPQCVVIVPFVPLVILWNLYKGKASLKIVTSNLILYVVGLSMSVSPFIVRNYLVSGEFVLISSQGGFNLYTGNNLQNKDPYYRPVSFASSSPFEQGIQFTIEASRRVGVKLSPQKASFYWTREVIKTASEQPGAFIWKIFQKTLVLFNQFEAGDHYHIGFVSDFVKFFKLPFLGFWLILPLGLAGMAMSSRGSGKSLALIAIFLVYALTLIAFHSNTRYRLPTLIILIPFTVTGIKNLLSHTKKKQFNKISTYSVMAIAFFIIEFLPVRGTGDMTAYYNTHAINLDLKGFEDGAVQYWEKSSQMKRPYSAFANLSLAGKYYRKGYIQKAAHYLDSIPDDSFAAAPKFEMLGDIMADRGQIGKAISAYEKSLEINSGQRRARIKLVKMYRRVDKQKAADEYERFKYISSFYDTSSNESDVTFLSRIPKNL